MASGIPGADETKVEVEEEGEDDADTLLVNSSRTVKSNCTKKKKGPSNKKLLGSYHYREQSGSSQKVGEEQSAMRSAPGNEMLGC